ncbi:MAG: winged helix-turn-helix domain-containing protein [Acidobacteriota bacterium]
MIEEEALPLSSPDSFRVGDFLIRPTLKAVRPFQGFDAPSSAEKDRRLPDKAIAVLLKLADHPRQVVTREELLDDVWGQEREAYDRVLDNAISELRRAFGDKARKPRYIETITKQGYRLIAPVERPQAAVSPGDGGGSDDRRDLAESADRADGEGRGSAETPAARSVELAPGPHREASPGSPQGRRGPDLERGHRAFRRLFIALGLLLVGAAVLSLVTRVQGLRIHFATFENSSGDPRFDDADAQIRRELERSRCPDTPLSLRQISLFGATSLSGRVVEEQGRLTLEATLAGPTVSERIELEVPLGGDAPGVLATFAERLQQSLDRQFCTTARGEGAACPCRRLAERQIQEGDLGAAEASLARALEASPADVATLETAVDLRLARGEAGLARKALGALEERSGSGADARRLAWWRARVDGDPGAELAALEALRAAEPEDPRWALALGRHHFHHRRSCDDSLAAFDDATVIGAVADRVLAEAPVRAACGRAPSALNGLERLVEQDPGRVEGWIELSRVQRRIGLFDDAKKSLNRALALRPDLPAALLEMAERHRARGQLRRADADFLRYGRSADWPRGAHRSSVGRALVALAAGDVAGALESADAADRALGPTADAAWIRGRAALGDGRPGAAAEALRQVDALGRGSRHGRGLYFHLLGRLALADGDPRRAIDAFYDAVEQRSADGPLFTLELARAFLAAGQEARAAEVLEGHLEKQPRDAPALCALGDIRERRGDRDGARALYRRAFDLWSDEPEGEEGSDCKRRLRRLETAVD